MQNCTFLVLLRPIFAQKMKTAPSKRFGSRSSEVVAAIRPEEPFKSVISAEKSDSISVKTFFFGDHLFLGKKLPQSDSRAMKIWVKVAYSCLNLPKKPPPFTKSWLRACAGDHELIPHKRAASFCTFWQLHLYSPKLPGPKVQQRYFS